MEPYLTIREVAGILRLSKQTIQRYVMNKEIPYLKIKKVIRFRPADIERWAERGGMAKAAKGDRNLEGDLFGGEYCPPGVQGKAGETALEPEGPGGNKGTGEGAV